MKKKSFDKIHHVLLISSTPLVSSPVPLMTFSNGAQLATNALHFMKPSVCMKIQLLSSYSYKNNQNYCDWTGQLSDYDSSTQYHSESRFILQNISQLHKERGPKTKLNCTYFAMDRAFEIFPIGTVIRQAMSYNSIIIL